MIGNISLEKELGQNSTRIKKFFAKEYKVKYKKNLSGKVRLYVSEKNALRGISRILSQYKHLMH